MMHVAGYVFVQYAGPSSPDRAKWEFLSVKDPRYVGSTVTAHIVNERPARDVGDMALHMDWSEGLTLYDRIYTEDEWKQIAR